MRDGNLKTIKLFTIVCIEDEFALYLYSRTHQVVSSNMIVNSDQIETCTVVEKLNLKKLTT